MGHVIYGEMGSLTAEIISEIDRFDYQRVCYVNSDEIIITYINPNGDKQESWFRGGKQVSRRAKMADGSFPLLDSNHQGFLPDYLGVYSELGPGLMRIIPPSWKPILGDCFERNK